MSLREQAGVKTPPADVPSPFKEAVIMSNPDEDELLWVKIPSFSEDHLFGPCPWSPRIVDGDSYAVPTKGDRALVVESEDNTYWVIDWWPYSFRS